MKTVHKHDIVWSVTYRYQTMKCEDCSALRPWPGTRQDDQLYHRCSGFILLQHWRYTMMATMMFRKWKTAFSTKVTAAVMAKGWKAAFSTDLTAAVMDKGIDTLRMPWSWQKYCLHHYARMCCSLRIVTRCCFANCPIRCESGGRNVHFLSIHLFSFRRSRGIVLVMASLAWEMDSASRQWNTEKDVRNVRDFGIKRLPSGGTRSCMPQQTRYAGVHADWEQKLRVFRNTPNPHCERPHHCQWVSKQLSTAFVIGQIRIGLKSTPRWRYGAVRLAPMQWRCSSNLTTAFRV